MSKFERFVESVKKSETGKAMRTGVITVVLLSPSQIDLSTLQQHALFLGFESDTNAVVTQVANPTQTQNAEPILQIEDKLQQTEDNKFSLSPEQKVALKAGLGLFILGYLLMTNAQRAHNMETARKIDRQFSKLGITLQAIGAITLVGTAWTIIDKL